jgi:hypothetical protein
MITNTPLEVRDESGQTVGYVLPAAVYHRLQQIEAEHRRLLYAYANSLFADEELDRASRDGEEYTTEEVLKHLGQS